MIEARAKLRIQDLTIEQGGQGLHVLGGGIVTAERVVLRDNQVGASTFPGSLLHLTGSHVHGNLQGVTVAPGSSVTFRDGVVESNTTLGIWTDGSTAFFGSQVRGPRPVWVTGGTTFVHDSRIAGSDVMVDRGASLEIPGGVVDATSATIRAQNGARLSIWRFATLDVGNLELEIRDGASLFVAGTLNGRVRTETLGRAIVGGTINGFLRCGSSGEAVCPGTVTTTNCSRCSSATSAGAPVEPYPEEPMDLDPRVDLVRPVLGESR